MNKEYFISGGIILLIAIAFLFGYFYTGRAESPGPHKAKASNANIKAEVLSLSINNMSGDCGEDSNDWMTSEGICPNDKAILEINSIDRGNDTGFLENLSQGDKVEVEFKYSARPAKLVTDIKGTCREGRVFKDGSCYPEGKTGKQTMVSSPEYEEKPVEMDNGYLIFHLPQRKGEVKTTTLPGLSEGDSIKFEIWLPDTFEERIQIENYEKLS